jgi:hypothetical protein
MHLGGINVAVGCVERASQDQPLAEGYMCVLGRQPNWSRTTNRLALQRFQALAFGRSAQPGNHLIVPSSAGYM